MALQKQSKAKLSRKAHKKKRSRRKKAPILSYFVEALISWVSFQDACCEARYDFLPPNLVSWNNEKRDTITKSFDVLMQDVEITKLRIELFELQLDFESGYSAHVATTAPINDSREPSIYQLSETNVREFTNAQREKRRGLTHDPTKPRINRHMRRFILEDHDYMNVAETNLDSNSSDEEIAKVKRRLHEAFLRLQSGDFSKRKCFNIQKSSFAKKAVIKSYSILLHVNQIKGWNLYVTTSTSPTYRQNFL